MKRQYGFPKHIRVLSLFDSDRNLKSHPQYTAAKAGNPNAALDLVIDLAVAWLYANAARFSQSCTFVAPHAKEATGDNAIPQTLAAVCAVIFKGNVDTTIVQTDRVYHTGADPMERMATRATFEGSVATGDRSPLLAPLPQQVRLLTERFHHAIIEIFNIEPHALTANEAGYLVGFKSVDEIRNRLAKAEQEIDRRLRSKGIARTFEIAGDQNRKK